MDSSGRSSAMQYWLALTGAWALPTVITLCLVGYALGNALSYTIYQLKAAEFISMTDIGSGQIQFPVLIFNSIDKIIAAIVGICCVYSASVVLGALVGGECDTRDRFTQPNIAPGISRPVAWTAFIVLLAIGLVLRPTLSLIPAVIAVAAICGVWMLAYARFQSAPLIRRIGGMCCVTSVIVIFYWGIYSVMHGSTDLTHHSADDIPRARWGDFLLNSPTLLIAFLLVVYVLIRKHTSLAIIVQAFAAMLVPLAIAMAIVGATMHEPSTGFLTIDSQWNGGLSILTSLEQIWRSWFTQSMPQDVLMYCNMSRYTNAAISAKLGGAMLLVPTTIAFYIIGAGIVSLMRTRAGSATGLCLCQICGYPQADANYLRCSECGAGRDRISSFYRGAVSTRDVWIAITGAAILCLLPVLLLALVLFEPLGLTLTRQYLAALTFGIGSLLWLTITVYRTIIGNMCDSRRKQLTIGLLTAGIALLNASLAAILQYPVIAAACIGLWFITRWLQEKIPDEFVNAQATPVQA